MAVGPVDVVIIGFPGNKFSGQIAPAIVDLVNSGTIRVVDLLFVMKDESGTITTIEAGDLGEGLEGFLSIDVMQAGALNEEDADEVAAADGFVIDQIRIPVDVVNALVSE